MAIDLQHCGIVPGSNNMNGGIIWQVYFAGDYLLSPTPCQGLLLYMRAHFFFFWWVFCIFAWCKAIELLVDNSFKQEYHDVVRPDLWNLYNCSCQHLVLLCHCASGPPFPSQAEHFASSHVVRMLILCLTMTGAADSSGYNEECQCCHRRLR